MVADRILLIENPAELSIDTGRLRIRRESLPDAFVAPDDVAAIVLHHSTVQVSHSALQTLAAAGAIVIVTDAWHMPSAYMLPTQANRASPSRLRLQIDQLATPIPDVLWQSLVQGRIRTQAATLRHFGCNGALRLERMVSEVEPGDATHREGQAARHYWQYLFDDFKRSKQGAQDPVNTRLNYGYAVLRALVARELAAAGLSPELGLGHVSIENPFNLADDFMEPFRFLVERQVKIIVESTPESLHEPFTGAAKKSVIGFMETEVGMGKQRFRANTAVRETVASYVRILETRKGQLALPSGDAWD
ncbi:MAG: type II CRISPR-associated endonuclease Cas1 [Pseudomonadota bacterium]